MTSVIQAEFDQVIIWDLCKLGKIEKDETLIRILSFWYLGTKSQRINKKNLIHSTFLHFALFENFIFVPQFSETLDQSLGQSIDVSHLFNIPVLNALWRIVAGQAF